MLENLGDLGDPSIVSIGSHQLQVVPTAEELIAMARTASFGLPPRPRDMTNATLVILVGDSERITELLIDWLVEAANLLRAPAAQIDREILGDGLAVPHFIVDGMLDQHEPMHNRSRAGLFHPIGDNRIRVLFRPVLKCLVANLAGALKVGWRRLTIESIKEPSRDQFSDACHRLLHARADLFRGTRAAVHGILVLPMQHKERIVRGPMSEVARRLQGCIKTSPGSTTVAGRWLARQSSKYLPGQRPKNLDEESATAQKPPVKVTRTKKKSRIPTMSRNELAQLEQRAKEKNRRDESLLHKKEAKIAKKARKGRPTAKLEEEARGLRIERRKTRRKLRLVSFIRERRQSKKNLAEIATTQP